MILPFVTAISRDVFETVPPVLKEAAYGVGATTFEVVGNIVIPYTRVGVIGGVMLALGRALGETMAVTFVIGNATKISTSILAQGTTISAMIANQFADADPGLFTSSLLALGFILFVITFIVLAAGALDAGAARSEGVTLMANLYPARRRRNAIWTVLAYAATAFGLSWLVLILGALLWKGFGGLSLDVFTKMTAPPGVAGGLLNSIVGSLIVTAIGLVDRRAARHSRRHLSRRIRPLLAARRPSCASSTTFCSARPRSSSACSSTSSASCRSAISPALAGGVALAVIATPIIVRTTEDMLNLVPNTLREAASALGMPRSLVIRQVAYRAVRSRHHHRHPARGRAHDRRDGAADLHRARQFAVHRRSDAADVEPAARSSTNSPAAPIPSSRSSPGPAR